MIFDSPVYPIPPSFKDEELEFNSTLKYLKYLDSKGAKIIMSTAGTSQYNLLSPKEIRNFNVTLCNFPGKKILGIPPLSLTHIKQEIAFYNELSDVYLLILFPERYYNNEQIVEYFQEICSLSKHPVLVHGNSLRKGYGGTYEYDFSLLKELSKIKGFIGMKEESSTLDFSMNNIQNLNLEIIVAGGSMRRFWSLEPFGATTYLAGVGSFNPEIEEKFYEFYKKGNFKEAKLILETFETPLFNTFMKVGWHASMKEALFQMNLMLENRKPFIILDQSKKDLVNQALNKIL